MAKDASKHADADDADDELDPVETIERIMTCRTWIKLAELLLEFEPTDWEKQFLQDLIRRRQQFVSFKQRITLARMVGEPFLEHLPQLPPRDEDE